MLTGGGSGPQYGDGDGHLPIRSAPPLNTMPKESRELAVKAALTNTSDKVEVVEDSTPTVAWATIITKALRYLLLTGGPGLAVLGAQVTDSELQTIVGITITLIGAAWGFLDGQLRAAREHQIALASAAASAALTKRTGEAVIVPVQPPPSMS